MVPIYYSPAYVGANYAFDTTRKAKWVADSLIHCPIAGLDLVKPEPLTESQLLSVHDATYIQAIKTGLPSNLANSPDLEWDERLWPMVLASNGGAVAAVAAAVKYGIAGSLSSGLHHARHAHGAGYCTFNGLVLAAHTALTAGLQNILILDLDAHCGGGTASLIEDNLRLWQIDIAVDSYDSYASTEHTGLDIIEDSTAYLPTLRQRLIEIAQKNIPFDLCLYNAGMDVHERCYMGGLKGITNTILIERERLVFNWCLEKNLPIAFVLAGGYISESLTQEELVELHRYTLWQASQYRQNCKETEPFSLASPL